MSPPPSATRPRLVAASATTGPRPRFRSVVRVACEGRYHFAPHRHPDHQLLIVVRGRYHCRIEARALRAVRGQAVLVAPGDVHAEDCAGPLAMLAVNFHLDGGPAHGRLLRPGIDPRRQRLQPEPGPWQRVLRGLDEELDAAKPHAAQVQEALLRQLFWLTLRALPEGVLDPMVVSGSHAAGFAERFPRLLRSHLDRPWTVADMAAAMGMPERSLRAATRQHFGESPARLFLRYRLERVRELLRGSALTLTEISETLGFPDPFVCSKAYKRHFHISPSHDR